MEIDLKQTDGLEHSLHVRLPASSLAMEKRKCLAHLARTRQLPGFRRGRVPQALIEQKYGAEAGEEAFRTLIYDGLYKALEQKGLHPAAAPQIVDPEVTRAGDVRFTARFEILPEIKLLPLESLKIERTVCEPDEADLDMAMHNLLRQHTETSPVQRCAAAEDWVEARVLHADAHEGTSQHPPQKYDLMDPALPGELKTALLGTLAGDRVKVRMGGINEAATTLELEVLEVLRADRPTLDAEFVSRCGVPAVHTPEHLRTWLSAYLEHRGASLAARRTRSAVLQALHQAHDASLKQVPQCLVEQKLQPLLQRLQPQARTDAQTAAAMRRYATHGVEMELLLSEWVRHLHLKPEQLRVRRLFEQAVREAPDPKAARKSYHGNPALEERFESMALEEQLVEAVLENADVQDKACTYVQLEQDLSQA